MSTEPAAPLRISGQADEELEGLSMAARQARLQVIAEELHRLHQQYSRLDAQYAEQERACDRLLGLGRCFSIRSKRDAKPYKRQGVREHL